MEEGYFWADFVLRGVSLASDTVRGGGASKARDGSLSDTHFLLQNENNNP